MLSMFFNSPCASSLHFMGQKIFGYFEVRWIRWLADFHHAAIRRRPLHSHWRDNAAQREPNWLSLRSGTSLWNPLRIHCSLRFLQILLPCESLPLNQKRWSAPFSFANFAIETFWASVTILFFNTCIAFFFSLLPNTQDSLQKRCSWKVWIGLAHLYEISQVMTLQSLFVRNTVWNKPLGDLNLFTIFMEDLLSSPGYCAVDNH
jgi:hypothetical protein